VNETAKTSGASDPNAPDPFHYAVVDLANAASLRPIITTMNAPAVVTLFDQKAPRSLLRVAPWLVRLSRAPEVKAILSDTRATVPWGFYLYSTIEISSLRQSLRRFNLARLPDRERDVLFRYWDPRVMSVWLKAMTKHQHTRFFETVERVEVPFAGINVLASDPPGLGLPAAQVAT